MYIVKKKIIKTTEAWQPFVRLFRCYIKKYIIYAIIAGFLMIISASASAGIAYIVGPMINKVFVEKEKMLLTITCAGIVVLYFIKTLSTYIQNVFMRFLSERVTADIRTSFFEKTVKMPMKNLELTPNGKILSIFLSDTATIGGGINEIFVTSLRDLLTVVFLMALVFYNNFLLAVISVCIYPFIFVPLKKLTKTTRILCKSGLQHSQTLTACIVDVINGMKTIKSYGTEQIETHRFKKLLLTLTRTLLTIAKKSTAISPLTEFVSGLSLAIVLFIGGWQILHGYSDVGNFFSFFTALLMAHRPARSLSGLNVKITTCSASLERLFSFVDGLDQESLNNGIKPDLQNATIKYEHVGFDYSVDNKIKQEYQKFSILHDISFEIKPKQKIAFVGTSGSGKSTIVALLLGLYKQNAGKITFNDQPIENIALSWIRENVAYVGQDNFLFDDTIRNNITYGCKKKIINDDAILQVSKQAQIDFLPELKEGLDECVGYNGSRFSAGQKQRIAIARAIMKDAPIVIFDEATSALDTETERKIHDFIFNEMKDKTVILIAHRLSVIVNCDNIYVVEKGNIVENGKHEDLLNNSQNGTYRRLWNNLSGE